MVKGVYQCIIAGGGLAGLSLAILLGRKGYSVLLIEKKTYPYHKVCGEYVSNESREFLIRLGIPIDAMDLPEIREVAITDVKGNMVRETLTMGGFGISRFTLDHLLAQKASAFGVEILEETHCTSFKKRDDLFVLSTTRGDFQTQILVASFGRYAFGNFFKPAKDSENWIGVKYHIRYQAPSSGISLHTFKNGYCGISKVDRDLFCLCYLAKASLLKKYQHKIGELEKNELYKNANLKKIFEQAEFIYDKALTISNITFDAKQPVHDGVFYVGDSAGAIAPLTGNGMSNAMRSAFLLGNEIDAFFQGKKSLAAVQKDYTQLWNSNFKGRIFKGRVIQRFFCKPQLTGLFIFLMKQSKLLRKIIIRQTHGDPF